LGENWTCCIIIKQVFNSRKAQPFGIHFDIGCCRPIPSNVNLKKERPVCIFFTLEGHGDHYVKRVMRRRRGWVRTTRVALLSSRYSIAARPSFDIGCCRPFPATSTCRRKGKFAFSSHSKVTEILHGDVKLVMWSRGWVRMGSVASLSSRYNSRKA
jgi:hypothetical protein